jgi:hypothetical protein
MAGRGWPKVADGQEREGALMQMLKRPSYHVKRGDHLPPPQKNRDFSQGIRISPEI